jgi:hypothetical protein
MAKKISIRNKACSPSFSNLLVVRRVIRGFNSGYYIAPPMGISALMDLLTRNTKCANQGLSNRDYQSGIIRIVTITYPQILCEYLIITPWQRGVSVSHSI